MLGLRGAVLLGPAIDLARKVVAGLAEIAEPDRLRIEGVQLRQRLDLAGEDPAPRLGRLARQRRIPEHAPLFHRHDVEGGADHGIVGAQRIGPGDRKALFAERGDDAEFAVDRMGRRQQFSERLAPHHIGTAGRIEPIGRVRLAALELQDGQRSLIAFDMLAHPAVEAHLVDAMPLLDRLGAREFLVFSDAFGHDDAPSDFFSGFRGSAGLVLPASAWWESWHTSEVRAWQWRGCGPRPVRRRAAWCASRRSRAQDRRRRRHRPRHTPGWHGR